MPFSRVDKSTTGVKHKQLRLQNTVRQKLHTKEMIDNSVYFSCCQLQYVVKSKQKNN